MMKMIKDIYGIEKTYYLGITSSITDVITSNP
jgi:hypothetical protein